MEDVELKLYKSLDTIIAEREGTNPEAVAAEAGDAQPMEGVEAGGAEAGAAAPSLIPKRHSRSPEPRRERRERSRERSRERRQRRSPGVEARQHLPRHQRGAPRGRGLGGYGGQHYRGAPGGRVCYICHAPDHRSWDCPQRAAGDQEAAALRERLRRAEAEAAAAAAEAEVQKLTSQAFRRGMHSVAEAQGIAAGQVGGMMQAQGDLFKAAHSAAAQQTLLPALQTPFQPMLPPVQTPLHLAPVQTPQEQMPAETVCRRDELRSLEVQAEAARTAKAWDKGMQQERRLQQREQRRQQAPASEAQRAPQQGQQGQEWRSPLELIKNNVTLSEK